MLKRSRMEKLPKLSGPLLTYKELLLKWSKAVNLVSPSTLHEADTRHFDDSLQLLPLIPEGVKTVFDLGSGAGFPGLVIALARKDLSVHLFESDQKKCAFLSTVSRETDTPVLIHNERIENVDKSRTGIPDVITARALASLSELLGLSEVWWEGNPQVVLIFPKGAKAAEEVAEAQKKFVFDLVLTPSRTDKVAQILTLTRVARR